MIFPAIYKITYYDSIEGKESEVSGCTFAENFTKAMRKIEDYYGEDIIDVKMMLLEENSILEFENSDVVRFLEED